MYVCYLEKIVKLRNVTAILKTADSFFNFQKKICSEVVLALRVWQTAIFFCHSLEPRTFTNFREIVLPYNSLPESQRDRKSDFLQMF